MPLIFASSRDVNPAVLEPASLNDSFAAVACL